MINFRLTKFVFTNICVKVLCVRGSDVLHLYLFLYIFCTYTNFVKKYTKCIMNSYILAEFWTKFSYLVVRFSCCKLECGLLRSREGLLRLLVFAIDGGG